MSIKTEIPGVNNAVQKLEELADRMKSDDFGFRNNDVDNIDKVIDALHQLETERKSVHDSVETETIKASVLRYQLKILPKIIRKEVMDAVMAARKSNAKRLLELQDQITMMNANIIALDKRSRELEQENAVLHPERELLKQQHEEIISQLNQRMAEKAQLQIALNETRDEVRQANQDIVDLEDGILLLKEDLIEERTEARHEKNRLKKALTDTAQKTKQQKDENVIKKRELDIVQEKLMESEGKLDSVSKCIRRYETSRAKLEGEERAQVTQLAHQLQANDEIRIRGAHLMNERINESRNIEEKQQELKDKITEHQKEIAAETGRVQGLKEKKKMLLEDLEEKEHIMAEDKVRVAELDAQLQAAKDALNAKAEEVGAMQLDNIECQQELDALEESHKAVLAQLNKQISEYREELAKERKERLDLQVQKDTVAKDLDDLRTEAQKFMTDMADLVQGSKKKHTELSSEGLRLQKELKADKVQIDTLKLQLTRDQDAYDQMFARFQHDLANMEAGVLSLERALEDKTGELEDKTPIFLALETHFNERTIQYDAMKKEIVAMKNKRQSLEDEIKRVMREKETTIAPQAQLREDLKVKRTAYMRQIKNQGDSTQTKEQQIFEAGCKLRVIIEENKKFDDSCKKLDADIADLQCQMEDNDKRKEQLQAELIKQKEELMKKWQTDNMMQEFFASRDEATAEAFGRLLSRTEKREVKIDLITDRLKEELEVLAGFLDNISTRRPKGQRSKVVRVEDGRKSRRTAGTQRTTPKPGGSRSHSRSQSRERGKSANSQQPDDTSGSPRQSTRDKSQSPQRSSSQTPRSKERSKLSFSVDITHSEISDD